MFLRAAREADRAAVDEHVLVRGRDMDVAGRQWLTIERVGCFERARAHEQLRKDAGIGPDVTHDQHRRRKIRRESRCQLLQGRQSSGGCAHDDDSIDGHRDIWHSLLRKIRTPAMTATRGGHTALSAEATERHDGT